MGFYFHNKSKLNRVISCNACSVDIEHNEDDTIDIKESKYIWIL